MDRWHLRGHGSLKVEEDGVIFTKLAETGEGFALFATILNDVSDLEGKELTLSVNINGVTTKNTVKEGWLWNDTEHTLLYVSGFHLMVS